MKPDLSAHCFSGSHRSCRGRPCQCPCHTELPVEKDKRDILLAMVYRMRAAQKRWFRDSVPSALLEAKDLERRVDKGLKDWSAGPGLYDGVTE